MYLQVTVSTPSRAEPFTKELDMGFSSLGRALAGGHLPTIAKAVLSHEGLKELIMLKMIDAIDLGLLNYASIILTRLHYFVRSRLRDCRSLAGIAASQSFNPRHQSSLEFCLLWQVAMITATSTRKEQHTTPEFAWQLQLF